jgi:hypothetical protein
MRTPCYELYELSFFRKETYWTLDMRVTIAEALDTAERYLFCRAAGLRVPAFVVNPLR